MSSNRSDRKDVATLECTILLFPVAICFNVVVIKVLHGYESFSNDSLIIHINDQQRCSIFFRVQKQSLHRTTPIRTFVLIILYYEH